MLDPEKLDKMFERSPDHELKGFLRLNPELRRQSLSYSVMISRGVLNAKEICALERPDDVSVDVALTEIIKASNCAMFEVLDRAYTAAIVLHQDAHDEVEMNRIQVNFAREKLRDAVQALINYDLTISHVYDVAAQNGVSVGDEPLTRDERINSSGVERRIRSTPKREELMTTHFVDRLTKELAEIKENAKQAKAFCAVGENRVADGVDPETAFGLVLRANGLTLVDFYEAAAPYIAKMKAAVLDEDEDEPASVAGIEDVEAIRDLSRVLRIFELTICRTYDLMEKHGVDTSA